MNFAIKEADLIAYDNRGRVLLLVEVKRSRDATAEWAAKYRRNLMSHGTFPFTRFFLIATLNGLYFWRQEDESIPADAPPQFTLDAVSELNPIMEKYGFSAEEISKEEFRLVVSFWLEDLSWLEKPDSMEASRFHWLSESGFLDELKRSRIGFSEA